MNSSLSNTSRRYLILACVITFVVAACGGGESGATTSMAPTIEVTSSTSTGFTPEPVSKSRYSIVEDASYLNVRIGGTQPVEASDDPELGDWIYATGPIGAQGPAAGFIMYRRYTEAGREDLAVLLTPYYAVDAIRLTGDTSGVHLGLACDDGAVVLTSDGVPMNSTRHHVESAIQAWSSGPDGDIEEFDPTTGESRESC